MATERVPEIAPVPIEALEAVLRLAKSTYPTAKEKGALVYLVVDLRGVGVLAELRVYDTWRQKIGTQQYDGQWDGDTVTWSPRQ